MNELLSLKGIALSRYKSISEFAKKLGWTRGKLSRILNGKQEPNSSEVVSLALALEIPDKDTFLLIFFPCLSNF